MKRAFDIFSSGCALLCFAPIMLVVAVLIKLESKGPVLFKQQRVGLNGSFFSIYKFRSMVADAPERGPHFTQKNDSRITRVGRVLRKSSIDELPQLLNVLRGEMSVVGPRPNVSAQRAEYTEEQWVLRNSVRPGITGLAQALVRSGGTAEQRTALDLEYVANQSFLFDLKIILLTVKQVFFEGGN
ncbi:sugar transferase [Halodesulfovibrio sp.]|jgi:lipopolysaccharide/colanic/teichoic acid biosynthesis glycosyltransferase|uniref:sugar transferase n=1 Tax=Halodesulfovibrio sp. TaxID=1912772 RepID=UPI0025D0F53F|nr:sugar transferase [Halodesulfovibrio sp.]MCT4626539.1 sugar transferase [Halodesulfovibrio sp.]